MKNLIENCLILYFSRSNLNWPSIMFSGCIVSEVFAMWLFILGTKFPSAIRKLLNIHNLYPYASSPLISREQSNEEWSCKKEANMLVCVTLSWSIFKAKEIIRITLSETCCMTLSKQKVLFIWILDSPNNAEI